MRTEVNGVTESRGQNALLCARALLEYDSKVSQTVDWRAKIETQRGAVIATELKNNSNKLAEVDVLRYFGWGRFAQTWFRVSCAPERSERALYPEHANVQTERLCGAN